MKMTGVRGRLLAGFGAILFLLAVVGVAGWRYTAELARDVELLHTNNLKAVVQLAQAERGLWHLRAATANYLLGSGERAAIREESAPLIANVNANMNAYASGRRTPDERRQIEAWRRH